MEKENQKGFIKWFSELNKKSINVAGGKGSNLAEIYNLKVQVPPGFVVTAQSYDYFLERAKIKEKIQELLDRIDYEDTKKLDEITKQIRSFIIDSEFPKDLEDEIIEAYENLSPESNKNDQKDLALDILKAGAEPAFVAVRSSATAEDLEDASFAGQQDSYLNIKGNVALLEHIRMCFASLFTSRATYYRNQKGFKHSETSLAVVVQKMVDSEKSGVIFSKDPSYKNENTIIEAVWGLGTGIVSGKITPDKYVVSEDKEIIDKKISTKRVAITRDSSGQKTIIRLKEEIANAQVLKEHEIKKLTEMALKLEEHYKKPQDIEFAIEGEEIYITQTRAITTIEKRIDKEDSKMEGEVILEGLAASPGIASGKIKIIENLEDLDKVNKGDVLVTTMTSPDMVVTMQKSSAIVTDEGGLTAHASIVSREMGIPCVVGTQEATTLLKEGEVITVDGFEGKIYRGKTSKEVKKEILPVSIETKTKIKVMVDLPSFAERASKAGLREIGLTRIEGIIAESGKHPNYFLKQNKINEYEELIYNKLKEIMNYFDKSWVRTSDIRSDEFEHLEGAPKEKEANPMLGYHGIRYSLKNQEILKAEFKAMSRIAKDGKEIGFLLPQVINVEELVQVKAILKESNISNLKVGIMIETPAAVQQINDLCEEGIDFISFGTNDLTQYILAVDRGNSNVQELYDEMHPAILYQLGYVIRVCKRKNVETSICGQAGSKKPMVKYLIEQGIDSISVNADVAKEISEFVKENEDNLIKDTDKEPRQYQPKETPGQNQNMEKTPETENTNKEVINEKVTQIENITKKVINEDVPMPMNEEVSPEISNEETAPQRSNNEEQSTEINENESKWVKNKEITRNEDNQSRQNEVQQDNNNEQPKEGIVEKIKEAVEETEEAIKEIIDKVEPSTEEEFYHQTLEQPKDFTPDELPKIPGIENLRSEKTSEKKEETLDIF